MKLSRFATIAILASALMVSACANTIRGVGRDAANTVNATEACRQERRQRRELAAAGSSMSASQAEARTLCLRFMYSLAVSTATAASRQ